MLRPLLSVAALLALAHLSSAALDSKAFSEQFCADCHNGDNKKGGLDLESLTFDPKDPANFARWVKVHDRVEAGEMPPKKKAQPEAGARTAFLKSVDAALMDAELSKIAQEGRATQRRLNGYEYENALRDLFAAEWLQVKEQFPEDGEASRFNKIGDALDVSHVHMARYISAAENAMREILANEAARPPSTTTRYYARDQRTLTSRFTPNNFNSSPDRMTYPVLGLCTPQPEVRMGSAPLTDPTTREEEGVGWVSSNYVTGFSYRWDGFRAPVDGTYRLRFCGFTLWTAPGGHTTSFAKEKDKVGKAKPPSPELADYDHLAPGRRDEPITVYSSGGNQNRRLGTFDLTPRAEVHDLGAVELHAFQTVVPDATRFFRSRPGGYKNPLMDQDGAPSVAFRWMEVEGPLVDEKTHAAYQLLFGELPLQKVKEETPGLTLATVPHSPPGDKTRHVRKTASEVEVETVHVNVISHEPTKDAERLMRNFLQHAYRRPVVEKDVQRFLSLVKERRAAGLSFAEAMLAGYTAVLASPEFIFLNEQPGALDNYALAMRLSLFLWNSPPDAALRARAEKGELTQPAVLRAETERMLADPKAGRFERAFLDYWLDLRKMQDSTPSTTLYNDYYLDDSLAEAAELETRLYFHELVAKNLPVRDLVDSNFTYANERLAIHYDLPGVKGVAMRRVELPPDSPRGGFMTQASILKLTANGTTTSPVLRGKWILERILGIDIPPPPPVGAVEPDIRGAVTIRQQLDKHRADASCATCHRKMDPPGFALENFDVMGGWRDRYRGSAEKEEAEVGIGKNGHPFGFRFVLPVDAAGELPDGRPFHDIRDFKQLLRDQDALLARNLTRQFLVFATGAAIRYSDRPEIEKIVQASAAKSYGVRELIRGIVASPLFVNK